MFEAGRTPDSGAFPGVPALPCAEPPGFPQAREKVTIQMASLSARGQADVTRGHPGPSPVPSRGSGGLGAGKWLGAWTSAGG